MNVPSKTDEIFDRLSKGEFICSNSSEQEIQQLYAIIDNRYEDLKEYFAQIGFDLKRENEYFYMARRDESKASIKRKIDKYFKWIDIFDFLKTFDNTIDPGYRFTISEIHNKLDVEANLKEKLEKLSTYTRKKNYRKSIQKIIDMLCKEGFAELENEVEGRYKILASFKYLEDMIMNINIPDEIQNEISE